LYAPLVRAQVLLPFIKQKYASLQVLIQCADQYAEVQVASALTTAYDPLVPESERAKAHKCFLSLESARMRLKTQVWDDVDFLVAQAYRLSSLFLNPSSPGYFFYKHHATVSTPASVASLSDKPLFYVFEAVVTPIAFV